MKIAFFIGLYPFQLGGAEMQATEIAKSLQKLGHDIYFVSYSKVNYTSPEFNVTIIPTRSKWDIGYLQTKRHIEKALNNIKPDLIYHRAFVPYSHYIVRWALRHKVPFYFHSADAYTLNRPNTTLYNIINNILLKITLIGSTGVICQNNEQKTLLEKYKLSNLKKIYNMHSLPTEKLNIDQEKKGIVWIGKFIPMKNPEAFIKLAKECDANELIFYMFSSREPEVDKYNELLSEINSLSNIRIIVGKDNDYINSFLVREGRVLVNTSISEGISNTYIQAWMRGLPVLSLNSNPDNWFSEFEIGYCCDGEETNLKKGLIELLNKTQNHEYKKNIIKFSNSNFSSDIIINEMCEFMHIPK